MREWFFRWMPLHVGGVLYCQAQLFHRDGGHVLLVDARCADTFPDLELEAWMLHDAGLTPVQVDFR